MHKSYINWHLWNINTLVSFIVYKIKIRELCRRYRTFYHHLDIYSNDIVTLSLIHSHCPLSLWTDDNLSIFWNEKGKPAFLPKIVLLCIGKLQILKVKINGRPRDVVFYIIFLYKMVLFFCCTNVHRKVIVPGRLTFQLAVKISWSCHCMKAWLNFIWVT